MDVSPPKEDCDRHVLSRGHVGEGLRYLMCLGEAVSDHPARLEDRHAYSSTNLRRSSDRLSSPTIPSGRQRAMIMTSSPIMSGCNCATVVRRKYDGMYTTTAPRSGPIDVPTPPMIIMASIKSENVKSNAGPAVTPEMDHA